MNFKQLSPIAWEVERGDVDCRIRQLRLAGLGFHIRLEQDNYVIDVFDSTIESPDEAYLTSHECETWEQVVRYCTDYDGVNVI